MTTGFIGLGIMGSRMAANLAKENYNLLVFNRTKKKANELLKYSNVEWAENMAEIAAKADVLFTMLSAPDAVRTYAIGEEGFLNKMKKGTIWIDSSTVNPSFSLQMAKESKARGIHFVDAPVAGSKAPAESGELLFLVGGEKEVVEKCVPYFNTMGKNYVHVGKNSKGTSLKMVFNLLLGQAMYAFSEGMTLGEALGIDKEMLFNVLLKSPVVAPFVTLKKDKMDKGDYESEFPMQWMQKDLQLASQTAYEKGIALPGVNVIKEIYSMAKNAEYAEKDFSAIYEYMKNQ